MFQGDIYEDVPLVKVGAGDSVDSDPKYTATRRHAAVLLHPCYIVGADNATPIKSQPVVAVYQAAEAGLRSRRIGRAFGGLPPAGSARRRRSLGR